MFSRQFIDKWTIASCFHLFSMAGAWGNPSRLSVAAQLLLHLIQGCLQSTHGPFLELLKVRGQKSWPPTPPWLPMFRICCMHLLSAIHQTSPKLFLQTTSHAGYVRCRSSSFSSRNGCPAWTCNPVGRQTPRTTLHIPRKRLGQIDCH